LTRWLYGLEKNDISTLLSKSVGQPELTPLQHVEVVEYIERITYGFPLAVQLIIDNLQKNLQYNRNIDIHTILQESFSANFAPSLAYKQKITIGEYLLSTLLHQFSEDEQEQIIECSVPRVLDLPTLKTLLPDLNNEEARNLWERYSRYTFTSVLPDRTLVFHPLLRQLATRRLLARSQPDRNYYKVIHSDLREYFAEQPVVDSIRPQIDEAYHALALGDAEPAVSYISFAITNNDTRWKLALETIVQAPMTRQLASLKQDPAFSLSHARVSQNVQDMVRALILRLSLLNVPELTRSERVTLWYELSEIYRNLPIKDQQEKQKLSDDCFEKAHTMAKDPTMLTRDIRPTSSVSLEPFPVRKMSRAWRKLRTAVLLLVLLSPLFSYLFLYYGQYANTACNAESVLSPINVLHSLYFSHHIRIVHAGDRECVGLSDGNFAFDTQTNPAAGMLKEQASTSLIAGDTMSAESYWNQALQQDSSDAEALIYKENQRVLNLASTENIPYVTVVLLTTLTARAEDHNSVANGRDSLQGAYIAQIQHNRDFRTPLLRILIANCGGTYAYAAQVANQIIQAKQDDPTIVGVMGPAQSRDTSIAAIKLLGQAHIPIISETATSDDFTNISPSFFRVAPSNKYQVEVAVQYAESHFNAKTAVVFQALNDNYSESLTKDFTNKFVKEDGHKIIKVMTYTATDQDASNVISDEASNACSYNPDFIYFTGRSDGIKTLLDSLGNTPCGKDNIKIIGADTLDQLTSSLGVDYPYYAYNHLYYTTFAFPYEWTLVGLGKYQPSFFNDYPRSFDPDGKYTNVPKYGYTLPNGHMVLAYDAMTTMLYAVTEAVKSTNKVTLQAQDLVNVLRRIHGSNTIQGASGVIDFGANPNGDPVNKVIVMVQITDHGEAKLAGLEGNLMQKLS
jgi:ABC-type branched-subunit amino acid transport system substrate-binding protein